MSKSFFHRSPARRRAMLALALVGLLVVAFTTTQAFAGRQTNWTTAQADWVLKDKQIHLSFSHPMNWHVVAHPDSYYLSVQNVAPFNNPSEVPGGLPEGFVKFSVMVDPKLKPADMTQGESISINGRSWQVQTTVGGAAGEQSVNFETVQDGRVVRVYTHIIGTGGQKEIFDRHAASLDQMMGSLKLEPATYSPPEVSKPLPASK